MWRKEEKIILKSGGKKLFVACCLPRLLLIYCAISVTSAQPTAGWAEKGKGMILSYGFLCIIHHHYTYCVSLVLIQLPGMIPVSYSSSVVCDSSNKVPGNCISKNKSNIKKKSPRICRNDRTSRSGPISNPLIVL